MKQSLIHIHIIYIYKGSMKGVEYLKMFIPLFINLCTLYFTYRVVLIFKHISPIYTLYILYTYVVVYTYIRVAKRIK